LTLSTENEIAKSIDYYSDVILRFCILENEKNVTVIWTYSYTYIF